MLILISLTILLILGIIIAFYVQTELGVIIIIISGVLLFVALFALPINYYDYNARIQQFNSTKMTLEIARKNESISLLELAAIQQKVIEMNQWLASAKYYNQTIFDIWIPNAIEKLEPIK